MFLMNGSCWWRRPPDTSVSRTLMQLNQNQKTGKSIANLKLNTRGSLNRLNVIEVFVYFKALPHKFKDRTRFR